MRLTIHHQTTYSYAREIALQPHKLIVTPRDSGQLTTIDRSLRFEPDNAILDLAIAAPPYDWVAATERNRARSQEQLRKEAGSGDFKAPAGGLHCRSLAMRGGIASLGMGTLSWRRRMSS